MSLRPTGLIVGPSGLDLYTVIDDPDSDRVLLIPGSFAHRLVVGRDELAAYGELHPARAPVETGDGARLGSNEQRRAEEDALIPMIMRRDDFEPGDRMTPRMTARRLIDRLDQVRRAPSPADGAREESGDA